MIERHERIGPDTLLGSTPTLAGICDLAGFRLTVRYASPGAWRERSTWATAAVGTISDVDDGSLIKIRFSRANTRYRTAFLGAYLAVLILITITLTALVLAGAEGSGPVVVAPIGLLVLFAAPVVVQAFGRRREAQDRRYLLSALESAVNE